MTNEEREQMMKMAEMLLPLLYANMPKNIKEALNTKAEAIGMSGEAFLIQTVEKTLWSRELATADSETALAAIKGQLSKLINKLVESGGTYSPGGEIFL